jgi:hypothetical protein
VASSISYYEGVDLIWLALRWRFGPVSGRRLGRFLGWLPDAHQPRHYEENMARKEEKETTREEEEAAHDYPNNRLSKLANSQSSGRIQNRKSRSRSGKKYRASNDESSFFLRGDKRRS